MAAPLNAAEAASALSQSVEHFSLEAQSAAPAVLDGNQLLASLKTAQALKDKAGAQFQAGELKKALGSYHRVSRSPEASVDLPLLTSRAAGAVVHEKHSYAWLW